VEYLSGRRGAFEGKARRAQGKVVRHGGGITAEEGGKRGTWLKGREPVRTRDRKESAGRGSKSLSPSGKAKKQLGNKLAY